MAVDPRIKPREPVSLLDHLGVVGIDLSVMKQPNGIPTLKSNRNPNPNRHRNPNPNPKPKPTP